MGSVCVSVLPGAVLEAVRWRVDRCACVVGMLGAFRGVDFLDLAVLACGGVLEWPVQCRYSQASKPSNSRAGDQKQDWTPFTVNFHRFF